MTVISKDEFKVFYGVRKTTRVAAIAEAHEAIKGLRNVVNVVVLPPNAGDPGNQDSDTAEVSAESIEEIYEPSVEFEIEEDLESDDETQLPLPNKYQKKTTRWKKVSGFERAFQREEPISPKICQILKEIHLTQCGKICFPGTYWSTLLLKPYL